MPSMRWAGAKAGSSKLKRWILASATTDRLAECSDLWTRYEFPAANLVTMGFGRQTPILESGFAASLVHLHCIRHQWPGTLLPFCCFLRELSPLERSQGQQGACSLRVRKLGKAIALRRFAQAIFTGFHVPPKTKIRAMSVARAPRPPPQSD
jgi:hypothetical protein